MRIWKSKVMAGMGVREFQYRIFGNPPTRSCKDDKKYTKCRGTVDRTRLHEKWNNLEPNACDKAKG
jgi:hypothetical protein